MSRFLYPDAVYVEMHSHDKDGNRIVYRFAMEPADPKLSTLTWAVDNHFVEDFEPTGFYKKYAPTKTMDTSLHAERWRFVDPEETMLVDRLVQERLERQ